MNTSLDKAQQCLLEPAGLSPSDLERILSSMLGGQIDAADLYFQSLQQES
jgi:TldD protein